jgi:hypothetical protein
VGIDEKVGLHALDQTMDPEMSVNLSSVKFSILNVLEELSPPVFTVLRSKYIHYISEFTSVSFIMQLLNQKNTVTHNLEVFKRIDGVKIHLPWRLFIFQNPIDHSLDNIMEQFKLEAEVYTLTNERVTESEIRKQLSSFETHSLPYLELAHSDRN